MKLILSFTVLATIVGTSQGGGLDGLGGLLAGATHLANSLGTSGNGQVALGNGRVINWSFQGMIMGLQWKYMGVCTYPPTGDTVTVFKKSKGGAVEHCLKDLFQKLNAKQEL